MTRPATRTAAPKSPQPAISGFPLSTRESTKTGSYPHLTAVIHRLFHSLSTGSVRKPENAQPLAPNAIKLGLSSVFRVLTQ